MYTNCFIQISLFLSNQLLWPPAKKSITLIDNLPPSLLQHNSCMTPTNFHTKDHNTISSLFTLHTSFIFPSIPHPPKFDFMHMYVCKMFYNMSLSFHKHKRTQVCMTPPLLNSTQRKTTLYDTLSSNYLSLILLQNSLFHLPLNHLLLPPYLSLHHPPPPLPVPSSFTCS